MKKFLLSVLFFVGVLSVGFGATFFAVQDGNWNDGATWGNASPGTEGVDWPGASDFAATNGFSIQITGEREVNGLALRFDVADGIYFAAGGGFPPVNTSLTVKDFIGSYNASFALTPPTATIIRNNNNTTIIFDGSNVTGSIFRGWSDLATLQGIRIDGGGNTLELDESVRINGTLQISSGELILGSGNTITQSSNSTISIASGASFTNNGTITGDGSNTSFFNRIIVNGTFTTFNFANFSRVDIGSGGVLDNRYFGTNQLEGWWYQNSAPGNFVFNANSTVIYGANSDQNVFALSDGYGNLNVNSSSATTKTLVGLGNQLVKGAFSIQSGAVTFSSTNTNPITLQGNVSNSGSWTTTQQVNFTGTNDQVINGSNPISFGGEVRINKSSGNVTLQLVDQTINSDLRILQGTFRPLARNVTLTGDIINDGIIEAVTNSTGGFVFNGTTEISGSGTTQFRNVTIDGAGSLSVASGVEFEVTTNFTNNGAFTHNDGTVRFTQTGSKSISGSSTTSFYDLGVEGGTVNIDGTVELENVMSFAGNPTVDFDGSVNGGEFTLKSTQTRDASIGNVGSATLQGNLNVERAVYTLRGDNKGYHMVGFPINGATIGEVQSSGFRITGSFTGASTGTASGDGFASIFTYNESNAGAFSTGYTNFPGSGGSTSSNFNHGSGYFMFTYDGDAPGTITTNGTLFTGDFSRNLSFTNTGAGTDDGWHMVANPYPSATNWDSWTKTNTELDAWVWNPAGGAYEALVDGNGDVLPQGQAFFIRATSSGASVSTTEASKVSTFQTYFRSAPEPVYVKIGLDNGSYIDYTYLGLRDGASYEYNGNEDASRLLNSYETISTKTTDGKAVKVNRVPFQNEQECSNSIFINLEQMVNGKEYKLKFENIANLSSKSIQLYDHYLDQLIEINPTDSLQFTVNSEASSKGDTRFEIILENKTPANIAVSSEDICPSEDAILRFEESENFTNYLVYKNSELVSQFEGTGSDFELEISNEFLDNSVTNFDIEAFVIGCDTISLGSASIQVFDSLNLDNNVEGSSICRSESQASFSIATQLNASYYILNNIDTIETITGTGNIYDGLISSVELEDGVNEFTIAASKDACQSGTLSQSLTIEVQNPTINEDITFSANSTCLKSPSEIRFSTQAGVEYQILKGSNVVNSITGDGTDQTVAISDAFLSLGTNDFIVNATSGDCASFEFPEPVQILVEENINTNLSLVAESICGNADPSVIIENAQSGKTYTLKSGEENLSSLTADTDGQLTFNISSSQLNVGLNGLDIEIQSTNCGTSLSSNQAIFTIYEAINSNLDYLSADVCSASEAVVGISNAQVGKVYKLYTGGNLVESIEATTTGEIVFANANAELIVGDNTFNVVIESAGCSSVEVEQALNITLYESINANLEYLSSDVCNASEAIVGIANAQSGKVYKLYKEGNLVESIESTATGEIVFANANDQLIAGNNTFNVIIESEGCEAVEVEQALNIRLYESINTNLVYLSSNVCNASEAVIGIGNAQAGKVYKLYKGSSLVQTVIAQNAGEIIFESANDELIIGENTFNVYVESEGCEAVAVEQELSIRLYEAINPDLDILTNDVCAGEQVNIEISNPQVGKIYKLMSSEDLLVTQTAVSGENVIFSLPADNFGVGSHSLLVDIEDDNCGSARANHTVDFQKYNEAIISEVEDLSICSYEEVIIDLVSNVEMNTYQLYLGTELIEETTGSSMNLSPAETTTYTLTGTSASGCPVNEINFTINVTDLATPGILVSSNLLESSIEGDTYQWYLNGHLIEGENGKMLVAQQSGNYSVEVNQGSCTVMSEAFTFNDEVLSANRALEDAVHLYPNPVTDYLFISVEGEEEIDLKIYNVSGEFLDHIKLTSSSSSIDMTKFSQGTFLLQLESGKGSITKRVVKK